MRSFVFFMGLVTFFSLNNMPSAPPSFMPSPSSASPSSSMPAAKTQPSMPTANVQAPSSMPMAKAQPAMPVAQPSSMMPAQPKPMPSAGSDSTDKFAAYNKELRELKDKVNSVDNLESDLLQQLKQIDNELEKATRLALETRKASIKILDIDSNVGTSKVEESFNEVKKKVAEIEQIQKNIDSNLSPKFESILVQVRSKMQKAQQDLVQLKEKGKALGLPTDTIKVVAGSKQEKARPSVKLKKKGTRTYIFDLGVSIVATIVMYAKKIAQWFIGLFSKDATEPKTEIKQAERMPGVKAVPSRSASTDPVLSKVRSQEQEIDTKIKKLNEEKKEIEAKRANLEKIRKERQKQITSKLKLMQQMGVQGPDVSVAPSGWKQTAQYIFGKFLDGVAFVLGKIRDFSVWFYKKYLQKSVTNFVNAVRSKIHRIEEKRSQAKEEKTTPPVKLGMPSQ